MEEEQGKKLDPNDPAIPAKQDKPTALPDEDLDKVAGGIGVVGLTLSAPAPSGGIEDASQKHSWVGHVTLIK